MSVKKSLSYDSPGWMAGRPSCRLWSKALKSSFPQSNASTKTLIAAGYLPGLASFARVLRGPAGRTAQHFGNHPILSIPIEASSTGP